jgi:hypothetical protein
MMKSRRGRNCASGYALRSVAASGKSWWSTLKKAVFCLDNPDHLKHSLISVFQTGTDEVIQSFWTSSSSLSYVHHSGLLAEIVCSALEEEIDQERSLTDMKASIAQFRLRMGIAIPGYHRLFNNLGLGCSGGTTGKEKPHE